jgi:predicted Zn-dependent peptidase
VKIIKTKRTVKSQEESSDMLNRNIAPATQLTESINIPQAKLTTLTNGSKLLLINEGDVDVCRIDIIFDAGSRYQKNKVEATATLSLLVEGTSKYSSQQISEHFDFYGSFINISADRDFAKVTAYSLNKHLPKTLEMLEEIVKGPSYPELELKVWSRRGKHNLTVELDKASTLSRMEFFKNVFGIDHPYGTFAMPNDYDKIEKENLKSFHSSRLGSANAKIVLSGKINDEHIKLIEKHFGNSPWGATSLNEINGIDMNTPLSGQYFVSKPNAVQSAIKVGRELFKKSHPDYPEMAIVNTILGGYFGSRLMKNIREDKGYTYGIGSYIGNFRDSGFLAISTEVGTQYTQQTLVEIKLEIERLKKELVTDNELSLVRSYLMGDALRSFNGPFAVSDNIIGLLNFNDLNYEFFQNIIHSIKSITPKRIMELSNKWLDSDTFVECVAGSENPF